MDPQRPSLADIAAAALAREKRRPWKPERPWRFRIAGDLWAAELPPDATNVCLFGYPAFRDDSLAGELVLDGSTLADFLTRHGMPR